MPACYLTTVCELLAHSSPKRKGELFYWHREQKSSSAEVDFVLQIGASTSRSIWLYFSANRYTLDKYLDSQSR